MIEERAVDFKYLHQQLLWFLINCEPPAGAELSLKARAGDFTLSTAEVREKLLNNNCKTAYVLVN